MKRSQVIAAVAVTVVLLVSIVLVAYARGNANPRVLPPTSRVQGMGYGDWLAEWWTYVLSVPADQNPLAGAPDACIFQLEGNVALVVGNSTLPSGKSIPCTVPAGKMLFVEVLGAECSTLEKDTPFYGGTPEELLSCAQGFVPSELQASIDGVEVQDLGKYIVASPVYDFSVPGGNVLGVEAGSTGQSAAVGAYLMLSPLRPGTHTIHLHGAYPALEFTADKTFTLTVGK
jgi:hypothetical protein